MNIVRSTLKYVADKDRKAFANDLKTIYNAPSEQAGRKALDDVWEKWEEKYPRAMKRWYDSWDAVSPIFMFSKDVRTVIYTTNAIESLNATYIAPAVHISKKLIPWSMALRIMTLISSAGVCPMPLSPSPKH